MFFLFFPLYEGLYSYIYIVLKVGVFLAFSTIYGVRYGEEGASPVVYFQVDTPMFRSYLYPSFLGSNFWEVKSVFRLLGARLCGLKQSPAFFSFSI